MGLFIGDEKNGGGGDDTCIGFGDVSSLGIGSVLQESMFRVCGAAAGTGSGDASSLFFALVLKEEELEIVLVLKEEELVDKMRSPNTATASLTDRNGRVVSTSDLAIGVVCTSIGAWFRVKEGERLSMYMNLLGG